MGEIVVPGVGLRLLKYVSFIATIAKQIVSGCWRRLDTVAHHQCVDVAPVSHTQVILCSPPICQSYIHVRDDPWHTSS